MSNTQYKVSIIVAVYNVQKYIHRCIESLQQQTYKNIEVILVNDGSTDKSGVICDEYASRDSRFKVIHQQNGGVSKARQAGLDAATGDYVIHADPDDYVDNTEIEELLAKGIETGADMVTCDFYLDGKYYRQEYKDEKELLARLVNVGIICVCWNVLVKCSFIVEHNVRFTPDWLNQSEDFLFMSRLLVAGASAVHMNKAFYHYSSTIGGSLSNKKSKKKIESLIETVKQYESILSLLDWVNLYNRKKYILIKAFEGHFCNLLSMYPDIHQQLIEESKGKSKDSIEYQLVLAIQGHEYLAYAYYFFFYYLGKVNHVLTKLFHK